jgi:hypothetical protein
MRNTKEELKDKYLSEEADEDSEIDIDFIT